MEAMSISGKLTLLNTIAILAQGMCYAKDNEDSTHDSVNVADRSKHLYRITFEYGVHYPDQHITLQFQG